MKRGPNAKAFALMAVATALGGGGFLYFQWSALGDKEAAVRALERERKDPKTLSAELAQSETNHSELADKLRHLELSVSPQAYLPTMLKELESTGIAQGIKVLGVRPLPPKAAAGKTVSKKPYDELDIEVKGRGKYSDTLRFIHSLNSFPKIVAVRSVTIEPKKALSKDDLSSGLDITVTLKAYLFKGPTRDKASATGERHEG